MAGPRAARAPVAAPAAPEVAETDAVATEAVQAGPAPISGLAAALAAAAAHAGHSRLWAASGVLHAADQRAQELVAVLPEAVAAAEHDPELQRGLAALVALLT